MDSRCRRKAEDTARSTGSGFSPVSDVCFPSAVPHYSSPARGFTLIELILATAISALIMGILSVCFSFTLRAWQGAQNQKPDQTFLLADLLKRQLAECDPMPIRFSNSTRLVFSGKQDSLAFITTHSVKAISHGAPVIARYVYDPSSKVLYYSELLLDPYDPASIQEFVTGRLSQNAGNRVRSYGVHFPEFVLAYAGQGSKEFSQYWNSSDRLPVEVLLRWKGNDSAVHAQICMLNTPFPIQAEMLAPNAVAGGLNTGLNQ